jgi:hypothetical protein
VGPKQTGTMGPNQASELNHRFLLFDLPAVSDQLSSNYEDYTLETGDPEVRVYIGAGILIARFAIYVALERNVVEAFWLTVD